MWQFSILLVSLISSCSAEYTLNLHARYAVKERHHVPHGWKLIKPAPGNAEIVLNIGLTQSNFDSLEQKLSEVSDPYNPSYGQHLDENQVQEYIKPSVESSRLVHEWLAHHGCNGPSLQYSPAKDWIKVSLPVREAERLLNTKYSLYRHIDGTELVRTPQWSLPRHLHGHIETIQPTNSFSRLEAKAVQWRQSPGVFEDVKDLDQVRAVEATDLSVSDIQAACNASNITPGCLKMLYGTNDYKPKVPTRSKIGYCNYLGETTVSTDMAKFISTYLPAANGSNVNIQIVKDGPNQQILNITEETSVEGNLDGQTIMGQVWPVPITAYNTGGRPNVTAPYTPPVGLLNENEPYLDWLEYMQSIPQRDLPPVISISYGEAEQSVPPSYARRVCRTFAQLGSRGVTILSSSGDAGVGSRSPTSDRCEIYPNPEVAADGKANFMPDFPASCPYVTAVGATRGKGVGAFNTEIAAGYAGNVSDYASGGGFSNYFARPAWQDTIVRGYMANLTAQEVANDMYNTSGRAYPDLAANGQRYSVVWSGRFILVDGTSASAPTMASIIALMNDNLMANGRPPLGFMNPWLYAVGRNGFTDIVSGSATGCGVAGFPAKTGWDAVTGFGTPNFVRLLNISMEERSRPGPPGGGFIDQGRRPHRPPGGPGPGGWGGAGGGRDGNGREHGRGGGGGWSWGSTWF